jgi:3-methyladenine DNA glycosylase AlkD
MPENRVERTLNGAMAALRAKADAKHRGGLERFGIPSENALGVSMKHVQAIAKSLGRDHALALGLWKTGCLEARCLAAYVDEPQRVTPAQMDRWRRGFDNWGVCDTLCFVLFDKTPHAWRKVAEWAECSDEFGKRAAFALLASLAGHDRKAPDERFLQSLPLIERAATDPRNFVKKGVSWALRRIGHRNARLHAAAVELAGRLAGSRDPAGRWVGKDTLRDLTRPLVLRRFE